METVWRWKGIWNSRDEQRDELLEQSDGKIRETLLYTFARLGG